MRARSPTPASAAPLTFFGSDLGFSSTNTSAARQAWENSVAVFSEDNLDGIADVSANSFENRFTTDAGSEFFNLARFNALLRTNIVLGGPLTGAALQLIPNSGLDDGDTIGFRWNFAEPVDSFGFFAAEFDIRNVRFFPRVGDESLLDGNGDPVRFRFEDAFEDTTNPLDNAFYGVSGLSQAVTSIRVFGEVAGGSGGGQGLFTNGFVTGSTVAPPQPIPFPAALLRLASGLAGLGLLARRRRG